MEESIRKLARSNHLPSPSARMMRSGGCALHFTWVSDWANFFRFSGASQLLDAYLWVLFIGTKEILSLQRKVSASGAPICRVSIRSVLALFTLPCFFGRCSGAFSTLIYVAVNLFWFSEYCGVTYPRAKCAKQSAAHANCYRNKTIRLVKSNRSHSSGCLFLCYPFKLKYIVL